MARWVERRATEEGWRVRLKRRRRADGDMTDTRRRDGRRSRSDGERLRGSGTPKLHSSRCFRCLGSGHWSNACREPLICRRCGGPGHMSFACTAGQWRAGREPTNQQEEVFEIQLGEGFNPHVEERVLRCCVVVAAEGRNPSEEEVSGEIGEVWGEECWSIERSLGCGTFILKVMNPQLRGKMVRRGVTQGTRGQLRFSAWVPEFGASSSETFRWHLRLEGLPLHWQHGECMRTLMRSFGTVTEIRGQGIDHRGVVFSKLTVVSGTWRKWPKCIVAGHGREAYRIQVEARRMPGMSAMSWADLLRDTPSENRRSPPERMNRGREPHWRKRRLSRSSSEMRREPSRQGLRSMAGGEGRYGREPFHSGEVDDTQGLTPVTRPTLMSEIHLPTSAEKRCSVPMLDNEEGKKQGLGPGQKETKETSFVREGSRGGICGSVEINGPSWSGPTIGRVAGRTSVGGPEPVGRIQQWTWIRRDQSGEEIVQPLFFGSFSEPAHELVGGSPLLDPPRETDTDVVATMHGVHGEAEEVAFSREESTTAQSGTSNRYPMGIQLAQVRALELGFKVQEQRYQSGFVNSLRGEFGPCGPFVQEDIEVVDATAYKRSRWGCGRRAKG
ncbi:hypothetical protein QJS10_CPB21g01145 [Acorus calamus]|uniref:CCHC-type domain-containing protein n=1 Tax=Acorus calamus TaxID=4465 RepID=A0AAV9C3Y5_ACOCL|nr:hypothetical protein QJS10_CPB21g01145 [Acorus calamus]